MRSVLESYLQQRISQFINSNMRLKNDEMLGKKRALIEKRHVDVVKCKAKGTICNVVDNDDDTQTVEYSVMYQFLIKQKKKIYVEEQQEQRVATFENGELISDACPVLEGTDKWDALEMLEVRNKLDEPNKSAVSGYNRNEAVKYAERWWNDYNPNYHHFTNDCTNYISQCLRAGGNTMRGYPTRTQGWWYRGSNWSFSWSVAHALTLYLASSTRGLRAKEVKSPKELLVGDIICYDFEGDGRFNHTTIVVAKDEDGMPLVNAHTQNSRMRYWSYEDSTAYTPNIKYRFYSIL
ncbi:hypothetical protein EJF36_04450 [Bacillus sp. HMF5848]|uniref:amidase domain-containing protein n=1 Tax=Bacillus sp. HMF5848 TaxID=2495421 RepID=UPI000F77E5B2|nr:amidase domain-containing protein [Bacillus sp. HMF5848]RSK26169.1 hypothetical protein EJF36_04450 [Bacillus sp. HMF5848]